MTDLPESWCFCKMPEIVLWTSGGTPKATEKSYYENGNIPWLVIGDLNDNQVFFSEKNITQKAIDESNAKLIPPTTLLLGMYGSIGKLGVTQMWCATNQAIAAAVSLKGIDVYYLFYWLKYIRPQLFFLGKGGTQKNISLTVVNSLKVPLPPLAEQGRIVEKIEKLFAEIDAGIENLKSIKEQIKLYRQSVLKNAFSNLPFEKLEKFIEKPRYGTSKKCLYTKNDSSIPVYRIPNIDFEKGEINLEDLKYAHFSNDEKNVLKLRQGDLLFIRSNGSLNLVGRCALIAKETQNALFAGYLIRIRVKEKLNPKFLLFFLNSGKARNYIEEKAKSTSGVNNINSEELSSISVPVPTLAEQERIVAEIEKRFKRADELEQIVADTLAAAEKLKQSVLKKAFSGELVPQNPDDEPASVLLDRIRAARSDEQKHRKKGK